MMSMWRYICVSRHLSQLTVNNKYVMVCLYFQTSLAANISNDKIEELSQSGSDLARFKAAFLASIQDSHVRLLFSDIWNYSPESNVTKYSFMYVGA